MDKNKEKDSDTMLEPNTVKISIKEFSNKEPLEIKAKILEENDK